MIIRQWNSRTLTNLKGDAHSYTFIIYDKGRRKGPHLEDSGSERLINYDYYNFTFRLELIKD